MRHHTTVSGGGGGGETDPNVPAGDPAFELYFEGSVASTTYTMGGSDASDGDNTGALNGNATVDETNDSLMVTTDALSQMLFVVSTRDIFDERTGFIKLVYRSTGIGSNGLFGAYRDNDNRLWIQENSSSQIWTRFETDGNDMIWTTTGTVNTSATNTLYIKWDNGNSFNSNAACYAVKINSGSWEYENSGVTITSYGAGKEPDEFTIGDDGQTSMTNPPVFKSIQIWLDYE